jgi:hypothetical protein
MKPWLAPLLFATSLLGQPPKVRLPDEAAGLDGIARSLISAFDQVDIVALGEAHGRKLDSDLRIAVVRHPDFAKNVRSIVVEFGSTSEQSTLDRYIRGENISPAQLAQVWRTTTQAANGLGDSPIYAAFFAAVRDVNSRRPADARVRVFGSEVRSRSTDAGASGTGAAPTIALPGFHSGGVHERSGADLPRPRRLREHIPGQPSYSRPNG